MIIVNNVLIYFNDTAEKREIFKTRRSGFDDPLRKIVAANL